MLWKTAFTCYNNRCTQNRDRGKDMAMTVLKVIFTLMLCVPIVYLSAYFLMRLIDDVVKQNKNSGIKNKKQNRSGRR